MGFSIHDRRALGRTGLMVSPIGLGGVFLGKPEFDREGDGSEAVACVLGALQAGIRLIDTSAGYQGSKSEEYIGLALDQWRRLGGRREDVVITTKTGTRTHPHDYSYAATMRSVEQSLRLLRTDWLDVVSIHDPYSEAEMDSALAPGGAVEALKKLRGERVIRGIGLGVRSHAWHERCIRTGDFDMSLTYRDYNLINQSISESILPLAEEYGVGVLNGTPVMKGLLAGPDPMIAASRKPPEFGPLADNPYIFSQEEANLARRLWEFANGHGVSLLALNLQYCLRERRISSTVLGASNANEIAADIEAISANIPEAVWQELSDRFGL